MATGSGNGWGLDFYDCVINNDLARLEFLVEQHKVDLNAKFTEVRKKNHLDLSPIHLVAYKGYTGMLQYLYDMKCDIHLTTATLRRTAFHFAVLRHKMACFHKLLSFGANADPRDTFGNSPCHYAAEDGACDILDVLLRQRIDLNAQDITLKTPLMKATRNGKLSAVKRLVEAGCALNIRDKNSDTALHFAARHGSEGLVTVLIRAGSDLNMQNQWGHTPLMEAVCYNNKDASARLLSSGCNLNLREYKGGDTALHVAVRKNYNAIVEQLLATGKVQNVYNYHGELAVYDAVLSQKIDTIRIFLHHNYDLDVPIKLDYDGTGGKTVVKVAMDKGNFELLRLLAKVGFLLSSSSSTNCRPLAEWDSTQQAAAMGWELFHQTCPLTRPPTTSFPVGRAPCGREPTACSQPCPLHRATSQSPPTVDAEHAAALQRFFTEVNKVRSLKEMSRKVIRKHVGFGIHYKVNFLCIPKSLQEYVLLRDLV
ncbi:hypothetical protein LSH36_582g00022 [Paralvinella palmiformis]|uniref:SOCS box domain-containing protein n=1 Tax=Paralvinella palmiformis TaxID=53620 RepID=A0AAD9J653_9ANNE|nr:hypothetical protein LSH36_582g00022 [Paralvinella palmiformis]